MLNILRDEPGSRVLMMGNEAIARGAVEAGVRFCAAYPGSPSSEIIGTLARPEVVQAFGHHAEWSTNEIVALEAAAGASFAGLRALCAMKQNGINVAADFLEALVLSGNKAGLVLVVCDDPSSHCSTNEMDSRNYVRFLDAPLLEPAGIEEAKEMARFAFELSEELRVLCVIRGVTRISHARGDIVLGPIDRRRPVPRIEPWDRMINFGMANHAALHEKLAGARAIFEKSPFNQYVGPPDAELVIIAGGMGWQYSREALNILRLEEEVGILKLGTTWPLPDKFILDHLKGARRVLFVEEVDPFLENNVKSMLADHVGVDLGTIKFLGKGSGHIAGRFGPGVGELDPDVVIGAMAKIKEVSYQAQGPGYADAAKKAMGQNIADRDMAFCAGCPHRASFWVMKNALALDGRGGVLLGDIGCYTLGTGRSGFFLNRTLHCMGSGAGLACGVGNLKGMGFDQPVLAVMGDSTFFHACLPALVNARYNRARFTSVVLDNDATAMTGFQPHPGTGVDAQGNPAPRLAIEDVCRGLGFHVEVRDPFQVDDAVETLCDLMRRDESSVLIMRRTCGLIAAQKKKKDRVTVDPDRCIGADGGCARFCTAVFGCPGLIWDKKNERATVDEVVCTGCGVCAYLCPESAIVVEKALEAAQ